MKKASIIKNSFLFLFMFFCTTGCDNFLEENPLGSSTTDNTFVKAVGYDALITSCYSILHDIAKQRYVVLSGTDLFTQNLNHPDFMNDYSSLLNSSNGQVENCWKSLYHGLQRCNTAIERVDKVEGMLESTIKIRYAEAVFLRALYHFFLVQQFGDIPYRDYEVKGPELNTARTPEAEVYTNIIADLESVKNDLPKLSEQETGRATWEAIRHLMAEVYLTRGWDYNGKLGGSADDFNKAADYADEVIASMGSLVLEPAEIFFKDGNTMGEPNDDNQEIIFSFRFSSDNSYNTEMGYTNTSKGNDYHNTFARGMADLHGIKLNGSFYGQPQGNSHQATEYATSILHPEIPGFDKRYSAFYNNVFIAEEDEEVTAGNFVHVGDTVVYYPGVEDGEVYADGTVFHAADILANNPNALIFTPSMYDLGTPVNGNYGYYIPLWKYFEPYNTEAADGERDVYYMRLAGTYLLSAEAHLKAGNPAKAAERYSAVRSGSIDVSKNPLGIDPDARGASNITIDDILDERARELAGEFHRWFDLKRTKTLYERVIKYNLKAKLAGNLAADATMKYYVRPIPQSEIGRVNNPVQNPGYN